MMITPVIATVMCGPAARATAAERAESATRSAAQQVNRQIAQPPADAAAACLDGTCTVTVTGLVEIPLDGRAGFTALSVLDVNPHAVTFVLHRHAGMTFGAMSDGGTARFGYGTGTLSVHVLEIAGDTARLDITTTAA
jgi:hypothetical protein